MEMSSPFGAEESAGPAVTGGKSKAKAKAKGKAAAKAQAVAPKQSEVNPVRTTERPRCCPCCCSGTFIWLLLNICVFYIGFYMHYGLEAYNGHLAYPIAKGGGFILDLNLAMLILPMMKSLQTALRGKLDNVVPMDDPIDTHIFLAKWVGFGAVVHVAAHGVLMYAVAQSPIYQRDALGMLEISTNELSLGFNILDQAL